MKVLFITDVGDRAGIGGHLYTIQTMVEALASRIECVVVSLGGATSPGFEALTCAKHRLAFGRGLFRFAELARFQELVFKEKPDVIHAFDPLSCAFARVAARRARCGLLLTLCGGPNPSGRFPFSYYPQVPRLVVFSAENEAFFRSRRRWRETKIWRIPNRVNEVQIDARKIAALRARLDPARKVLLRVGRISSTYGKTAEMSIRLAKRLAADGVSIQVVFLGVVQDVRAEAAIRRDLDGHGVIVSDPDLVARASAVLDVADMIVGTGRGLMEAASRGRVLLVPARTGVLPALVTEANWRGIFESNFSERSEIVSWDEERNYLEIKKALLDSECWKAHSAFSRTLFESQFSLAQALPDYLALYEEARQPERGRYVDLAVHWFSMMWRAHGRPLQGRAGSAGAPGAGSGDA